MVKVSVIIPVYNAEGYIKDCLESLFAQTLPADELQIIAVNDGSKDASLEILSELRQNHQNLLVIHQENQGASAARNAGLEAATGEHIGFVDADDWVEPHMYETLYNAAKENGAEVVFCNVMQNADKKMPAYLQSGAYDERQLREEIYPRLISAGQNEGSTLRGAVWCKLFLRDALQEKGICFRKELVYNEDGLVSIEATLAAKKYVYLGEAYLYHQRINADSITKRYIPDLWNRQKQMIAMLEQAVAGKDYDFSEQINRKALDIAVYSMENEGKRRNPNDNRRKRKTVKTIMCDKMLVDRLKKVDKHSLKRINRWYLAAIRLRWPALALALAKYRYRNNPYY